MARGATKRPSIGRRIKDLKNKESQLFSLFRRSDTPSGIQPAFVAGGGADPQSGQSNSGFLPTAGGTMIGPIAFFPKLITLTASTSIDIGKDTDDFTSRVILANPSSFDLATIAGAEHNGQLLFLQGVQTETITLKTTGNIETIDGNDFDIVDDDIIILQFDSTDNKWQQVTTGKNSFGGASQTPWLQNIDAAGFNLTDVGNLTVDGNVDLGDTTSDTISIIGRIDTNLIPTPNATRDIGTPTGAFLWRNLHVSSGMFFGSSAQGFGTSGFAGIFYKVDLSDAHAFRVNNIAKFTINNTQLNVADTVNFVFSGSTGTKIGTGTLQKLAFWGVTPVVQPSHISNPSGGSVIDVEARTKINAILADLAELGLQAAS